jgi:hypothetical protein
MRVLEGELLRFDSVEDILAACRARYSTSSASTTTNFDGEHILRVRPAGGQRFESLIVHFEGEGCYAVMLPDAASVRPALSARLRRWLSRWLRG